MSTKKKLPPHTKGSGNIFADLGLPNAEEHQLKAALPFLRKRATECHNNRVHSSSTCPNTP